MLPRSCESCHGLALPAAAAPTSTAPPLALRDRTPALQAFTTDLNDRQKTLHAKYTEKYRRLGVDPGATGGTPP
jgi:hypothetical protein